MILVAFKGRPDTRFFGEPTAGYTTGVAAYPLPDGAVMYISNGLAVDRDGNTYAQSIQPDEIIRT